MDIKIDELLDKLAEHVQSIAKTDTVVGDEFTIGEFTCKPVMKLGTGFGSGTGTGDDPKTKKSGTGGGAGAGIGMIPLGFLVARAGEISFIAVDKKKGLSTLFEKVPDLVEKIAEMKEKKEEEKQSREEKK